MKKQLSVLVLLLLWGGGSFFFPSRLLNAGDRRIAGAFDAGAHHAYHPVAAASGDKVFAAWVEFNEKGEGSVFFSKSSDKGMTWLPVPLRISDSASPADRGYGKPALAVSGTNVIVAFEVHGRETTEIHVSFSLDSGAAWNIDHGNHGQIFGTTSLQSRSLRTAAEGDNFYVLATAKQMGILKKPGVYLTHSPDAGQMWNPMKMDDNDPGNAFSSLHPDIAVLGSTIFVAWDEATASPFNEQIHCNISLDSGATWQGERRLDAGSAPLPNFAIFPRIAAHGSSLYAVWVDNRSSESSIFFNHSDNSGQTWQPQDREISTGTTRMLAHRFPELAVTQEGVFVTWQCRTNIDLSNRMIFFNLSHDGGNSWLGDALRLDNDELAGASRIEWPRLTVQGSDLYVAWNSPANGNLDIMLNRSSDCGLTWLPEPVRMDGGDAAGRSQSMSPSAAAVADGIILLWPDSREGRPDIYSRCYPDVSPVLNVSPADLSGGDTADFTLTGTPDKNFLLLGTYEGCRFTQAVGIVLDLKKPIMNIAQGIFDSSGQAVGSFSVPFPPDGSGAQLFRLQGVDIVSGLTSNVFRINVE